MRRAIVVSVRFQDDRYHGTGDWPPSPARLFQALVAGAGISGPLDSTTRSALRWLEACEAPIIASPTVQRGQTVKNYVPNNDLDAVRGDPRRVGAIRTQKTISPQIFVAHIPLLYVWFFEASADSDESARIICALTERIYHLGRSVDMAWAWAELVESTDADDKLWNYPGVVHRPSARGNGRILLCPRHGSLQSLNARYVAGGARFRVQKHGKMVTQLFSQAPKANFQSVTYGSAPSRLMFEFHDTTPRSAFVAWPLARAPALIEQLRDSAVKRLTAVWPDQVSEINRILIGRKPDGSNAIPASMRVKIIPLPSIGHHYSDHGIRRVLVEIPPTCGLRSDDVGWAFSGVELRQSANATEGSIIATTTDDTTMLGHYGIGDRACHVWRTVTPAVLPVAAARRRIDPQRLAEEAKTGVERAAEQERAATAVLQALRFADVYTRAVRIRAQREPFHQFGERVEAFAPGTRFPKERFWHVEITFANPVSGPLVIGDGRFLGLGIMAPEPDAGREEPHFVSVARFSLRAADRPSIAETLEYAELARRALLSTCISVTRRARPKVPDPHLSPFPPAFLGKDVEGRPLTGHQHAFFLPADEDGDGRLDHLTLFAPMGFNDLESRAIQELRWLAFGSKRVHLTLIGVGNQNEQHAPIFGKSAVWTSATPFIATRYPKLRGRKRDRPEVYATSQEFVRHVLQQELTRRSDLPAVESIETLDFIGRQRLTASEFKRCRRKDGDDGGRRSAGGFRVTFVEPVEGPLCLGHSCHFGLGMFVPETSG